MSSVSPNELLPDLVRLVGFDPDGGDHPSAGFFEHEVEHRNLRIADAATRAEGARCLVRLEDAESHIGDSLERLGVRHIVPCAAHSQLMHLFALGLEHQARATVERETGRQRQRQHKKTSSQFCFHSYFLSLVGFTAWKFSRRNTDVLDETNISDAIL